VSDALSGVPSKQGGERAAAEALQRLSGLGGVPDRVCPHFDAVTLRTLRADDDDDGDAPRMVGCEALPKGTRVEIKSVMVVYSGGTRGRFYFRPKQHRHLLDSNGVYLLAVCEPTPDRDILSLTVVTADHVDDALPGWFNGGTDRSDYAQLAWTNFFDPDEVSDGA
jgi:hypothetical protein